MCVNIYNLQLRINVGTEPSFSHSGPENVSKFPKILQVFRSGCHRIWSPAQNSDWIIARRSCGCRLQPPCKIVSELTKSREQMYDWSKYGLQNSRCGQSSDPETENFEWSLALKILLLFSQKICLLFCAYGPLCNWLIEVASFLNIWNPNMVIWYRKCSSWRLCGQTGFGCCTNPCVQSTSNTTGKRLRGKSREKIKKEKMYQCLRRLPGDYWRAPWGRTTDPLACAEHKQWGENTPK